MIDLKNKISNIGFLLEKEDQENKENIYDPLIDKEKETPILKLYSFFEKIYSNFREFNFEINTLKIKMKTLNKLKDEDKFIG